MSAQAPAGSITNPQFFDRGGIVQSALLQIVQSLGVAIELVLIESGSLRNHSGRIDGRRTELLEMFRRALPDGTSRRCLDRLSNRLTKILTEARKLRTP